MHSADLGYRALGNSLQRIDGLARSPYMDRRELLRLERLSRGLDRATRNNLIEQVELAELRDYEGTLRRRDFLRGTAHAAGLAGLATLPLNGLLTEAAKAQSPGLPAPA